MWGCTHSAGSSGYARSCGAQIRCNCSEHLVEHVRGEAAGLRIIAAAVIAIEKRVSDWQRILRAVSEAVRVPVVASGGAGSPEHLYQALTAGGADAALAASIFHYNEYSIAATKAYLAERGVPVRQI